MAERQMVGYARRQRETFNFLTERELESLEMLTRGLPPNPAIVNIGAGYGTSALTFVEARPLDATVFTVDVREPSHPDGSLENERMAFENAGLTNRLGRSWFQINGDSKVVGRLWLARGYPPADLLFIDGDHTYQGCASDINVWLPNVQMGGLIAIHDYDKAQNDPREHGRNHPFPGVDKAVRVYLLDQGYLVVDHVDTMIVFRKEP